MKALIGFLFTIHDRLTSIAAVLAAICLILITTFYVYEVVTRYIFDSPTAWVSDFVSYALCASVFLALPRVTKDKGHVAVSVLVDSLPSAVAGFLHSVISIAGGAGLGFAGIVSLQENLRQFDKNIETLAIVPIPQWWVSSFITFGLLMSALYMFRYAAPAHRTSHNALSAESE